jgi:hypothetical protein
LSSSDSPLDSVELSETLVAGNPDPDELAPVFAAFDFDGLLELVLLLWPLPLPAPLLLRPGTDVTIFEKIFSPNFVGKKLAFFIPKILS